MHHAPPRINLLFVFSLTCTFPLTATGQLHVDPDAPGPVRDGLSWDTAFSEIKDAVCESADGNQIWIADGTYFETLILPEGIELYGGFLGAEPGGYETHIDQRRFRLNRTIVDAQFTASVITMAPQTVIDGLTLTHGSGTFNGLVWRGGGVYADQLGPSGVIRNCTIVDNMADQGGGINLTGSSPEITNNWFEGNVAHLEGGAIAMWSLSSPLVANNVIINNEAGDWGGGISEHFGGQPRILHNTIAGNFAGQWGGGLFIREFGKPFISNNIVVNNIAGETGGGIHSCFASIPVLIRNNFWENAPRDYIGCQQFVRFMDISEDPGFRDAATGDYRLRSDSSMIDRADGIIGREVPFDFLGSIRGGDGQGDGLGGWDMGAFEFHPPRSVH